MSGTPTPPPEKTDGSTTGTPATGISQAPTTSLPDASKIFGTPDRSSAAPSSSNRSPVSAIAALFPGSASASASAPRSGAESDGSGSGEPPPPPTAAAAAAPAPPDYDRLFGIIIDALGGTGQVGENIVTDAGILDSNHEQSKVGLLQIGGDPRNPPLTDAQYKAEMLGYYASIVPGNYDDVVNTFSAFKHALDTLNVERDRDTDKGRIVYYELPTPPSQCERASSREQDKPLCWLCGCPTGLKNDQGIAMRKVEHSRAECEHVLPAPLMCLLEILYNKNIPEASLTPTQKDLRKLCYDNSCHLCNWQKSDAMFIQRQNVDGVFEPFKPNPMIIITELLNYFMTLAGTKSSDTDPVFWRGALDPEIRSYGSIVRVGRQDAAPPPPQRKFYPNLIRASLVGIPGAVYYGSDNPIRITTNDAIAQSAKDAIDRNDPDVAREAFGDNRDARAALESISSDISAYYRGYKTLPRGAAAAPALENAVAGRTWTSSGNLDVGTRALMTVNKRAAVNWIIRRFCSVFNYVNRICVILNTEDGNRLWDEKKAAIGGLTVSPMTWLRRLSNDNNGPRVYAAWQQKMEAKRLMSGKKRPRTEGGLRFTIRRRSETRQTKKNRRRKVIGTLIDDNQVSGTMMDVEMEGGGPGDEEEDRGYSTVESDAIRIPLGKKLKKEDVGRLAAIHETPNPEDDWTDALIQELSYTTKDDEMFTPKYVDLMETTEDGEEIITRTFLDEYGNPKGEPKILDNTLEGGGTGKKRGRNPTPTEGPARQRRRTDLTLDDLKRTPEQKRIAEQIVDTVMTPGKEGITAAMDSVTEIIKRLRPDFKGADRSLFEEGTVPEQCEGVLGTQGNVVGEICWLCGFAMNMYEIEGTGKTNGVDTKDLNTYMSQPSLDRASCEHKLPIKAAHYFQLMYQKLSKRNGQMSADQFERIKTLYGNAHAFCNYVKSEDLFLESVLGVKTFGEFKVNFIRIAGVNRPPTGISEDGYLKRLLMSVRKRDSSTKAISGLLSGNRFYYWGSQVTRMTGTGATHYRNGVMYRIHKMEDFKQAVASQYVNPRPTQTVARDDPGVNIPYTEFKSPSNKTVRKWLYEQATNIVGGLNELRVLLNSERDKLYTEGLQVINRKPFRENVEWWGLVVPYIEANPAEGEDFKHGLHLPLKDQIPEPKYKKPQLVWQPGQLGPQASGETDRITYDDDAAVSRMPSAAAPAPPPPPPAPQYDDNELLNVERKPLDESFNYDELLQLPGYTNTQGGGGGGRVSVIIRRRSDARTTKKNKKRRTIEVRI